MAPLRRAHGSDSGQEHAAQQAELGLHYLGSRTGDRGANLARAIESYTQALRFYTAETYPLAYAGIQLNLGLAYSELPTGDRAANLGRAIGCYNQALQFYRADTAPREYALTQNQLGIAYAKLSTGDQAANLETAIRSFSEVLHFITAEAEPLSYAQTLNNLGNAYRELPTGDRAANLTQAIGCYTEALRFLTVEASPFGYANTQYNLGLAYAGLPAGDRAGNLARSIESFTEALRVFTAEAAPALHAATQNNLGNAYRELPTGDRAANLQRAVAFYSEALRFHTAEATPAEYAAIQHNLGNAYSELRTGDRATNVARAIGCYTEALRFRTPEADPVGYAQTQTNLGDAYFQLPTGDREENLRLAIGCYAEALRFRSAEADPVGYAQIQTSLGMAYAELPAEDRADSPERAAVSYAEIVGSRGGAAASEYLMVGLGEGGDAATPAAEQRFLQGRFPERVRLGEEVTLLVRLALQPGALMEAGLRPLAVPETGIEVVLLLVENLGFALRSPQRAIVHVIPRQDSSWAGFELQATGEGVHTLHVEAFAGGTSLGGLKVQASVDATARTGPSTERTSPAAVTGADPGELSLLLSHDLDQQVYRYRLVDSSGYYSEEAVSARLLQPPGEAIEQLVAQLNALARGEVGWDVATTKDWLKNQGIDLWNGFIPQALQREFWQRRDQITQMTIVSDGNPVPWELLYPFAPGDRDAGFLIDQFPIARRRFGARPPSELRLKTADLVLSGSGSLAAAPDEIEALDGLLRGRGLAARRISDLPGLRQAIQRGDLGLLHFCCHNAFARGTPNASRIMLESQPFEPVFLNAHAGRFTNPLVFLNACRTDGQAPLYTTIEGWAQKFLQAGAGAFIGSLWEVVDTSASTYAWSPGNFVDISIMLLLVSNCQIGARNPLGLSCRAGVVSGRDCNIARCSRTRRS